MSSSQLSLPLAKGLKLSPKPPGEPQMGMDTDISFRGLSNPQIEKVIQSVRLGGGSGFMPHGCIEGPDRKEGPDWTICGKMQI